MQAFSLLLAFSVLFCIVCTAEGACKTGAAKNKIDQFKKKIKDIPCTCNKTSADYQNSCDCFEMPKDSNYNLTCYQESIVRMPKHFDRQFLNKTFPNLVKSCKSAYQPCGQMIKVNATVFLDRLTDVFQYFLHQKP